MIRYPDKKYSMGSFISHMAVSDDKSTLFLLDDSGRLGVYDILSQELVYEHEFEDAFIERMSLVPYKDDYVLVSDGFRLYLLNWRSGESVWTQYLWVEDGEKYTVTGINNLYFSSAESLGYIWKDPFTDVVFSLSPNRNLLAIEGGNDRIRILDPETGDEKMVISGSLQYTEGVHENAIQKIVWSNDGNKLAAVLMKGESLSYTVSVLVYDFSKGSTEVLVTDRLYWDDICFAGSDKIILLCTENILDGSYKKYGNYGKDSLLAESACTAICFSLRENSVLWETSLPYLSPWEREGICTYASKYALVSNTTIKIYDENNQVKTEIPTRGQNYIFAYLDSEKLYIAYDNANLFCYDASDGTELGTVTISIDTNDAFSAEFWFTEDTLYIKAGRINGRLSTIELENMIRRTLVEDCIGYCQETDEFLFLSRCSDDQYRIYKFRNYSVEELIAKGKAFIGGNTISSEMAAKYGLE